MCIRDRGYTIEPCDKAEGGTTIRLHIKPSSEEEKYDEFLESYRIQGIVKKYSDYIRYPIRMEVEKSRPKADNDKEFETYTENETLNLSLIHISPMSPEARPGAASP